MSGGSSGRSSVQRTELSPTLKPFVQYGLDEAQRLYQSPTPQYFPRQTFVSASPQTEQALDIAQRQALANTNFVNPSTQLMAQTATGGYLGGNPFFQGAFDKASRGAKQRFDESTQAIRSKASSMGRYGSEAQNRLQDRADQTFATSLADTANALAFDNYQRERARQEQAQRTLATLSQQDANMRARAIDQLLKSGQISESYQEKALTDALRRFNFEQNRPQMKLTNFLNAVYGSPRETSQTQPIYSNRALNTLTGGAFGAGIGKQLGAANLTPYAIGGALLPTLLG